MLTPGDPAPWFTARSTVNPRFHLDSEAGRYILLCFFRSAGDPTSRRVLDEIAGKHERFDVANAAFFGVTIDPEDELQGRLKRQHPGIVYFWDFDTAISRAYGAAPPDAPYRPQTLILDQNLRTLAVIPFAATSETHVPVILKFLDSLPPISSLNGHAPVLAVPYVFEPSVS